MAHVGEIFTWSSWVVNIREMPAKARPKSLHNWRFVGTFQEGFDLHPMLHLWWKMSAASNNAPAAAQAAAKKSRGKSATP